MLYAKSWVSVPVMMCMFHSISPIFDRMTADVWLNKDVFECVIHTFVITYNPWYNELDLSCLIVCQWASYGNVWTFVRVSFSSSWSSILGG